MNYTKQEIDYIRKRMPRTYEKLKTQIDKKEQIDKTINHFMGGVPHNLKDIVKQYVEEILSDKIENRVTNRILSISNSALIRAAVPEVAGVPWLSLEGKSRQKTVVIARQACEWLLREYTLLSLTQIGRYLDRDHSSVLHGIRKVNKHPEMYEHIIEPVESILKCHRKANTPANSS